MGKPNRFFTYKSGKSNYVDPPGAPVELDTSKQPPSDHTVPTLASAALHGPLGDFAKKAGERNPMSVGAILISTLPVTGLNFAANAYLPHGRTNHRSRLFGMTVSSDLSELAGITLQLAKATQARSFPQQFEVFAGPIVANRDLAGRGGGDDNQAATAKLILGGFDSVWWSRSAPSVHRSLSNLWDCVDLPGPGELFARPPIALVSHLLEDGLISIAPSALQMAARCMWAHVPACQPEPFPVRLQHDVDELAKCIVDASQRLGASVEVSLEDAAVKLWTRRFSTINAGSADPTRSLLGHGTSQVLRIAMIFALLDRSNTLSELHLTAAFAVWDYCRSSIQQIFSASAGGSLSQRVIDHLGEELSKTQLHAALSNHVGSSRLDAVLRALEQDGKIVSALTATRGRPRTTYRRVQ